MGNRACGNLYGLSWCVSTNSFECGGYGQDMAGASVAGSYDRSLFTCPDGTKVNIGPNFGGCAELQAAIFPSCDGNGDPDAGACDYRP